jgi:hypothetical protein
MPTNTVQAVPVEETIATWAIAKLKQRYEVIVEVFGQPHWREDPGFPGNPTTARVMWRMRDPQTGAVVCVWDYKSTARTAAETTEWRVYWRDGTEQVGSGRHLLADTIAESAGGVVTDIDDVWW